MGEYAGGTVRVNADTTLQDAISGCRICADAFARTATAHAPRPVVWFRPQARILVAGQAPGMRVHLTGLPFHDPSGARLRDWMGVTEDEFYDMNRVAVVPMAFCFPGYDAHRADLPPPLVCGQTWHAKVMAHLPNLKLRLLIGGAAQKWHLNTQGVTDLVRDWRAHAPHLFPLPHPSWRNSGWLKRNPWFEAELVPVLRARVRVVLAE